MSLPSTDQAIVDALLHDDYATALAELYAITLPKVYNVVPEGKLAKRFLKDSIIKFRSEASRGRITLKGAGSIQEYLVHACKERYLEYQKTAEIDRKIIHSLKNRDNEGWAFYYMQMHYFPMIKNWVRQNDGSEEEAKDLIMDGIEVLITNIREGKYQPQSNARLSSYFFGICKNKWYDQLKRRRRTRPVSLLSDLEMEEFESELYYEYQDDLLNERQKLVKNLFSQATDSCQRMLGFYYYDELPHEEIAKRMGLKNADTSKTQKNRCLQRLKGALKKIWGEERPDLP